MLWVGYRRITNRTPTISIKAVRCEAKEQRERERERHKTTQSWTYHRRKTDETKTSLTRHTTRRFEHDGKNNHNTTITNTTRTPNIKQSQRIDKPQQTVWAGKLASEFSSEYTGPNNLQQIRYTQTALPEKSDSMSRVLGCRGMLLVWFRVRLRVGYIKRPPNIAIRTLVKLLGK